MKATLPLLLLTACLVSAGAVPKAVWHFGEMIICTQPGINPLDYNEYGCYCGLGGGGTPVDDVDRCCQVHDKCYENSRKIPGCDGIFDLPHIISYDFTCSNKHAYCSATNDSCEAAACECDRAATECFARYNYNPDNKYLGSQYC
ncbi:PREDICTED: phospholipase A2 [Cyprinodon variegatus]|uniref:Phospholipase A2 n=1 Tax=Cyprinodon variegatus TaxID=28743 RepID=A0A3Q2CP48_CYPVA|nr:PREDICTED: phospholipase A2 [Cyprinodon variegatus]